VCGAHVDVRAYQRVITRIRQRAVSVVGRDASVQVTFRSGTKASASPSTSAEVRPTLCNDLSYYEREMRKSPAAR